MLTMCFVLAGLWMWAVLAPETPLGQAIARVTIEAPARLLAAITRGHVIVASTAMLVVGLAVWFGRGDGLAMVAMAAPDLVAWLAVVDLVTLADAAAVAVMAAASVRWRGWRSTKPTVRRLGATRARRVRRAVRRMRPAANDDDRPAVRAAG